MSALRLQYAGTHLSKLRIFMKSITRPPLLFTPNGIPIHIDHVISACTAQQLREVALLNIAGLIKQTLNRALVLILCTAITMLLTIAERSTQQTIMIFHCLDCFLWFSRHQLWSHCDAHMLTIVFNRYQLLKTHFVQHLHLHISHLSHTSLPSWPYANMLGLSFNIL